MIVVPIPSLKLCSIPKSLGSLRATFIPGQTNLELGDELDFESNFLVTETGDPITTEAGEKILIEDKASGLVRRKFGSIRDLIVGLIDLELEGASVGSNPDLEGARHWIKSLANDSDLFVDDAIIVHASPAIWEPLAKLFGTGVDASSVSAIVLLADSPGKMSGMLLAYGGARIFIRLVHGVNFVQDAVFERIGQRIRRGDYDLVAGRGRRRGK